MNPIEFLQSYNFRITSDPSKYLYSYPDGEEAPWGLRNYVENGIEHDAYCDGWHRAYDLSDKEGTALPAVVDGLIVDGTSSNGNFGGTVVLSDHEGDYQYIYGHGKNLQVSVGDEVKQGDTLAYQSNTNYYDNPMASHLHFQVQKQAYMADEKDFVCTGIDPLNIDVNQYKGVDNVSKTIAVDIGHDENSFPPNKGIYKNGKGYEEYDFNKKLGNRIINLLEANGFDVIYNNPTASLTQRTNYYDNQRPDLGISVHANAGASSVGGRCAFYWHSSSQGKEFASNIINNMTDMDYGVHGNGLHASQYGSWTNLHMIRESTTFPMVLVEHGFMTNDLDFPLIFGNRQNEYIEDMAEADVKAVCDYFGVSFSKSDSKPSEPSEPSTGTDLYRVQVGAYSKADNARNMESEVKGKGYSTYLAYDNNEDLYRVQAGAYSKKANAENQLSKLKSDGYSDAFIAGNDGHIVSDGDSDANETVAPDEEKTPYTVGEWQTNQNTGAQWIEAKGTFTVGNSPINIRVNSPSTNEPKPQTPQAQPGATIEYNQLCRNEGYVWIGYRTGEGGLRFLPYNTWNPNTGEVGSNPYGTFS